MEVIEIVADWLKSHGYDGLYTDECGCRCEDLAPCASEGFMSCCAGVYKPCDPATGFDFFIGPKEPTSDAVERENTSTNKPKPQLPADIKEKFAAFVRDQVDLPPSFAQVINDHFWDLL